MIQVARVIFILFAALLILGGIAGYVEKKSVMSLMGGVLCGGFAIAGLAVIGSKPQLGFTLGLVGAILAIGSMAPRIKDKKTGEIKLWPAGAVVAAGVVTAIVAGAGLATKAGASTGTAGQMALPTATDER